MEYDFEKLFPKKVKKFTPPPMKDMASHPLSALLTEPSWADPLKEEFSKPYFRELEKMVNYSYETRPTFPPRDDIFAALNLLPLEKVRLVILGQDPYHNVGQAMGLSFSVPMGVAIPSSLRNVFREIHDELGLDLLSSSASSSGKGGGHHGPTGDLTLWAKRGALLLNTTLTVEGGEAGSHAGKGWSNFTQRILEIVASRKNHVVFLLWGAHAREAAMPIVKKYPGNNHLVLTSAHPSGLSASRGFFGNGHFIRVNEFFSSHGLPEFDWSL